MKLVVLGILDFSRIFPLHYRYFFTDTLSLLLFFIAPKKRRAVYDNLSLISKRNVTWREVLRVFREYGKYWAELPDINDLWKKSKRTYSGDSFPPEEKNFLGVTYHIGNFEVLGNELYHAYNENFVVVAERLHPPVLAEYFKRIRLRHRIETIPHNDVRRMISVLKRGGGLGIVCDRAIDGKGVEIPFLGKDVTMPLNLVGYAQQENIPIYVAYCIKENESLKIVSKKIDPSLDHHKAMQSVAGILEDVVRKYPYQWHVLSKIE